MKNEVPTEKEAPEVLILPPNDEAGLVAHIKKGQSEISAAAKNKEAIEKMVATYTDIVVDGVKDLVHYEFLKGGLKQLKGASTAIEKTRKKLTAPALRYNRELKAHADELQAILTPGKDHVATQMKAFEDAKAAEDERILRTRCAELLENGYQLVGANYVCGVTFLNNDQIKDFDDDQFNFHVELGKKELARVKAEQDRKNEQEAKMAAMQKMLDDQQAAIDADRAAVNKERAEIAAQKAALDEQYGNSPKAEAVVDAGAKTEAITEATQPGEATDPEWEIDGILDGEPDPGLVDADLFEAAHDGFHNPDAAPTVGQPVEDMLKDAYYAGFYEFKKRFLESMGDESQKRNRVGWCNWAKSQAPGELSDKDFEYEKNEPPKGK